ncbi:Dyp-type peroxidase [Pleionea sp. CnH1-48]|uniref:Dyp-type peroxidase n=1 Tax=Pleionea sp. CnH1-48 TaxID=2954494 RepID=UPI002096B529|nr:Dyp-type peroxidase [Pleionea sp. CnH1-48]MCO7223478.1 Dyp-type peroxidase [Pleionea sp. CnH1-48]
MSSLVGPDIIQDGILQDVPAVGRYLFFTQKEGSEPLESLKKLAELCNGKNCVVGLGYSLLSAMDKRIPGLTDFKAVDNAKVEVPTNQAAIWCWLRGEQSGDLVLQSLAIKAALEDAFDCCQIVDGFKHQDGRDLTGYEDGTENPTGDDAVNTAFVTSDETGVAGSSFVVVQQWLHDFRAFHRYSQPEKDDMIGRRLEDNVEFKESPASAHTRRTGQESFEPEAFLLRRSMSWGDAQGEGLMFVAFTHELRAFEVQMARMAGAEDDIVDGIFNFTQPQSGYYFWCPPVVAGKLDLTALLD